MKRTFSTPERSGDGSAAVAIADAVRHGRVTATDVVATAVAAAEASQPALNAFTLIDREEALQRAGEIDRAVSEGTDPGPMAGVPVALKDLVDQAGVPNTAGSGFPAIRPEGDAPAVTRLNRAGAVIVGRTGLHEFAFGFTSENHHFGPVRNPWDPSLSPGGSSGGSAAAVAAGVTPIAVGTDTGGSVRVPAALCGILGLKVTWGRVPLDGVVPLAPTLDTVGPMARSVDDLETAYRVMSGDSASGSGVLGRVAVVEQWRLSPLTPDVAEALERAIAAVEAMGLEVERVDAPELEVPASVAEASLAEIARVHRARWDQHRERYGPDVAERLALAFAADPDSEDAAQAWAQRANAVLGEVFDRCDAVTAPTVGATRKVIGTDEITVGGVAHPHRLLLASWTYPINRLRLPALAVPLPGPTSPPPSLQLVGPAGGEVGLLSLGRLLEDAGVVSVTRPPLWFG